MVFLMLVTLSKTQNSTSLLITIKKYFKTDTSANFHSQASSLLKELKEVIDNHHAQMVYLENTVKNLTSENHNIQQTSKLTEEDLFNLPNESLIYFEKHGK